MSKLIRIDKYLADMDLGSRSQVKYDIKKGRVKVNGVVITSSDKKVTIPDDIVLYDNREISYVAYEYYMLHKPQGVVSATFDNHCETVIDLIDSKSRKDLFPVGRLDKDTEGLLIITNDGELTHRLLSPKKHVSKLYYAKVEGEVTSEDVELFKKGLQIEDEFTTLPADLKILESADISQVELTIYEGKFHQVKRMFEAVGKKVIYLKRMAMGSLYLDETLLTGEYRELTEEELNILRNE